MITGTATALAGRYVADPAHSTFGFAAPLPSAAGRLGAIVEWLATTSEEPCRTT